MGRDSFTGRILVSNSKRIPRGVLGNLGSSSWALRALHLEKALEVTTVPHQDAVSSSVVQENGNTRIITHVESEFFSVYKWEVRGRSGFSFDDRYMLFSIINGEGKLFLNRVEYEFKKGAHFIIPVGFGEFEVDGKCEMIVCHT